MRCCAWTDETTLVSERTLVQPVWPPALRLVWPECASRCRSEAVQPGYRRCLAVHLQRFASRSLAPVSRHVRHRHLYALGGRTCVGDGRPPLLVAAGPVVRVPRVEPARQEQHHRNDREYKSGGYHPKEPTSAAAKNTCQQRARRRDREEHSQPSRLRSGVAWAPRRGSERRSRGPPVRCRHPRIMAPLCQADARVRCRGVAFRWGPGCGLTEEPVVGEGPVTLVLRVVPNCPPGSRNAASSSTSCL